MINKLRKYYNYIERFIKSPRKGSVVKELFAEIKGKGLISGVQSILHLKSANYTRDFGFRDYRDEKSLVTKYERSGKINLPLSTQPLVSIIIPVYNELDYTYNCIRSIFERTTISNYEIIVADDNSTEDMAVLNNDFSNLIIIRNGTNLGFLQNCNHAATHAKGNYIVFLNNDTQVLDNWLSELLFVFDRFPKAGLVGSKLIYPNGLLQEAGGIIWKDGGGLNYGNLDNPGSPEYNYIKEADYVSGASLMIRKQLWNEIGGFDDRFSPAYCEDSDLCFQVRQKGYLVFYQPFSEVIHFEGLSHGRDPRKGIKQYQVVNRQKFIDKWNGELKLKSKKNKNLFFERDRSASKKHVLVIDHNVPTIDKDAGSRTISNFVDTFLDLGYSVKFLVPNMYPTYNYTKLLQEKGVEVLHGDRFVYWKHKWESYFKENIKKFDAILLSRSSICTPYIKHLKNNGYKGKTIYYGHDLGFLRTEQELEMTGDISLKKVIRKTKADEDYMYQHVTDALMISYEEIAYLKTYITTPLHYIPPYFFTVKKNTAGFDERQGILFVGGFHHPPNQDAMRWFLNDIYGGLEKEGIYLTIAGSEMPDFIFEYKQKFPSLTILPDVPSEQLEELYAAAKIAIVPLTLGAGVKGKVIEAMAKGVPIVGTDKAFEGLLKNDDFIYRNINDPAEFAAEIKKIYHDREIWMKLSDFGKDYVTRSFNKDIMKNVLRSIIE